MGTEGAIVGSGEGSPLGNWLLELPEGVLPAGPGMSAADRRGSCSMVPSSSGDWQCSGHLRPEAEGYLDPSVGCGLVSRFTSGSPLTRMAVQP